MRMWDDLNSSYLSKSFQSPCLLVAMMMKASKEKTRASPLNAREPLLNKSSLFHRRMIPATPNPVPAVRACSSVWFSTSAAAGGGVGTTGGGPWSCFGEASSRFVIILRNRVWEEERDWVLGIKEWAVPNRNDKSAYSVSCLSWQFGVSWSTIVIALCDFDTWRKGMSWKVRFT